MREELRLEAHLGRARDDVARRILDEQQRVGRAGPRGRDVLEQRIVERVHVGRPDGRARMRSRQPALVAHPKTAAVVDGCRAVEAGERRKRRRVRRVAGDSRAQQRVRGADAGREIRAVAHGAIDPCPQRVAIVGQQIDEAHRAARLGAEHRFDVTIVVGIELPFAVHRFEHFRTRQADSRAGQHRQPVGGACEHRRAAEHVADADGDDRNAVGARVEQRRERAGQRKLGGVRLVQPHAARREQQHDRSRPFAPRLRQHRLQCDAMPLADAAREEVLVLRGDEHRLSRPDAMRAHDDAVVVVRRDAEAREMRARTRRRRRTRRCRHRRAPRCARAGMRRAGSSGVCDGTRIDHRYGIMPERTRDACPADVTIRDERQSLRAVRSAFPARAGSAVPADPRRSGHPLRRPRPKSRRGIAHALVRAGCVPGDRVAVQADKHWQVLALYLACLRAGLVYLPLNTGYQRAELALLLRRREAARHRLPRRKRCGIDRDARRRRDGADARRATAASCSTARATSRRTFETVASRPDDLAAILYTSGTTGRSKGAMLTHRNLASNALALVEAWGFTRGDVLLHALPIYHVHGLFVADPLRAAVRRADAVAAEVRRAGSHRAAAAATVMMGVPTFYTRLLAEPTFTRDVCGNVRLFVSGSAPLLAETFDAFRARTGQRDPRALRHDRNRNDHVESARRRARSPARSGGRCRASPCAIVDDDGERVRARCRRRRRGPRAERVRAATGACPRRRARNSPPTAGFAPATSASGWPTAREGLPAARRPREGPDHHRRPQRLSEGNRGAHRRDGRRRRIRGHRRARSRLRRGRHRRRRRRKPATRSTETSIIAALKGEIATFKVPKRVHFVAELPRNAMGKVQKNVLRERFS